jgi:hypothetical protein
MAEPTKVARLAGTARETKAAELKFPVKSYCSSVSTTQ